MNLETKDIVKCYSFSSRGETRIRGLCAIKCPVEAISKENPMLVEKKNVFPACVV